MCCGIAGFDGIVCFTGNAFGGFGNFAIAIQADPK